MKKNLLITVCVIAIAFIISFGFITYESEVVVEVRPYKEKVTDVTPASDPMMTKEFLKKQFQLIKSEEELKGATEVQSINDSDFP